MAQSKVLDAGNGVEILMDGYGRDRLQEIIQEGKTAYGETEKHRINFQRYFKKRFGIRPTITTWPWRNAANLHIPYIDKTIRRTKPKFLRLVESVNPRVTFKSNLMGDDLGFVRAVERKFDDMLLEKLKLVGKVALGADKMLERGSFIGKVVQEFTPCEVEEVFYIDRLPDSWKSLLQNPQTTDDEIGYAILNRYSMDESNQDDILQIRDAIGQFRGGQRVIRFKRIIDKTDFPSLYIRDDLKIIRPYDTTDIEKSRLIRDIMTMTSRDIQAKGESGVWDKDNTYELLNRIGDQASRRDRVNYTGDRQQEYVESLEDIREGVYPYGYLPDVDEYYCYFKWPGDRLTYPSVLTINSSNTDLPLRFIKYPYVDQYGNPDDWPFSQVMFEIVNDRSHSSRGVPQMLDSIQTELTNNHNAKQNHMTIATSLNLKAKKNSNISTQWIPGQPLWVQRMDDAEILQIGPKDVSFDNEEKSLLAWGESYMGLMDNPLTSGGPSQDARTEKEIEKLGDIQDDVAYGDVVIFQLGMQKIYQQIYNRWLQYGPEHIPIQMASGEIMTIEKEEIRRRFILRPTGNLGNSSTKHRKNDALIRLKLFDGDQFINQHELRHQALMLDDERVAETLLLSPTEAHQSQVERQIMEIAMINMGYTSVPKLADDDDSHLKTIDDFVNDPVKMRNFNPDRLPDLLNHRQAHLLAKDRKKRESTRGGRLQQEVANTAKGVFGRQARNSTPADKLTSQTAGA